MALPALVSLGRGDARTAVVVADPSRDDHGSRAEVRERRITPVTPMEFVEIEPDLLNRVGRGTNNVADANLLPMENASNFKLLQGRPAFRVGVQAILFCHFDNSTVCVKDYGSK